MRFCKCGFHFRILSLHWSGTGCWLPGRDLSTPRQSLISSSSLSPSQCAIISLSHSHHRYTCWVSSPAPLACSEGLEGTCFLNCDGESVAGEDRPSFASSPAAWSTLCRNGTDMMVWIWKASHGPMLCMKCVVAPQPCSLRSHQKLGLDVRTRCQDRILTPNSDQKCELRTRSMYGHRSFHRTRAGVAKIRARELGKRRFLVHNVKRLDSRGWSPDS